MRSWSKARRFDATPANLPSSLRHRDSRVTRTLVNSRSRLADTYKRSQMGTVVSVSTQQVMRSRRLSTSSRGISGVTSVCSRASDNPVSAKLVLQVLCGHSSSSTSQSYLFAPGCILAVSVRSRAYLVQRRRSKRKSRRRDRVVIRLEAQCRVREKS